MSRAERAEQLFLEGYNCAQSVVGAFADLMEIDEKTALRMASPFGGGMGRLREVCGTVSGMWIVLGYLYGYDDPKEYDGKKALYARVQELAGAYTECQGSIICRELLKKGGAAAAADSKDSAPEKRTEEYYKKRPCPKLAAFAAQILDEYIQKHPCLSGEREMSASQ